MKSHVGCALVCVILALVALPAAQAGTYEVDDGSGDDSYHYGNASSDGYGGSCEACATADGYCPSSGADSWADMTCYTDEGGYFFVNWDLGGDAEVCICSGSNGSAVGAGGGSGYGFTSSDSVSLSNGDLPGGGWAHTDNPGIHGGTTTAQWFNAFDSVGANSQAAAFASAGQGTPEWASGSGHGEATVTLSSN